MPPKRLTPPAPSDTGGRPLRSGSGSGGAVVPSGSRADETLSPTGGDEEVQDDTEEQFEEAAETVGDARKVTLKTVIKEQKQFREDTRKDIDDILIRLTQQENVTAEMNAKLDELSGMENRLEARLEQYNEQGKTRSDQDHESIAAINAHVIGLEERMDTINGRLGIIVERLDRHLPVLSPRGNGLNTSTPARRADGSALPALNSRQSIIPGLSRSNSVRDIVNAMDQSRVDALNAAGQLRNTPAASGSVSTTCQGHGTELLTNTITSTTATQSGARNIPTGSGISNGNMILATQVTTAPPETSRYQRTQVTFGGLNTTSPGDHTTPAVSGHDSIYGNRLFNSNPIDRGGIQNPTGPSRPGGFYSQTQSRPVDPNQSLYLNQSVRVTPGLSQPGVISGFNVNRQGYLTLDHDSNPEDFFRNVPIFDPDRPGHVPADMDPFRLIYGCTSKTLQEVRAKVITLRHDYEWDDFIESLLSMSTFAPGMTDYGYKNIIYDNLKVANTDLQTVLPRRHGNTPLLDYILRVKQLVAPPYNATQLRVCFENLKQKPDQFIEDYLRTKFNAYKRMIANGEQVSPNTYFRHLVDGLHCFRLKKKVVGFQHHDNFDAMSHEILSWCGWIQNELQSNIISEAKARGTATSASRPPPTGESLTTDKVHELVLQTVNSLSTVNAKSYPNRRFNRNKRDVRRDTCFYCKNPGHWAKDCPKRKFGQDRAKRVRRANKYLNEIGALYRIDPQGEILIDCSKLSNIEPESESDSMESELSETSEAEMDDELNQVHYTKRSYRKGQKRRFPRGQRGHRKSFGRRRYFRKRKDGSINIVEATIEGDDEIFEWDQNETNHLEPEERSDTSPDDNGSPQSETVPNGSSTDQHDLTPAAASINTIGTLTTDFSHYEQDLNLIETDEDYFSDLHIDPSEKYYIPQVKEANLSTLGDPPFNPEKLPDINRESTLEEMSRIIALVDNQISPDIVPLAPPDLPIDVPAL